MVVHLEHLLVVTKVVQWVEYLVDKMVDHWVALLAEQSVAVLAAKSVVNWADHWVV